MIKNRILRRELISDIMVNWNTKNISLISFLVRLIELCEAS
jgi:hypothetical protein